MSDEKIEALTNYFAGPLVAHYSVCLQIPGQHKRSAEEYFKLRESFGIQGYVSKNEISKLLANSNK